MSLDESTADLVKYRMQNSKEKLSSQSLDSQPAISQCLNP